jgi:hypothetical protein
MAVDHLKHEGGGETVGFTCSQSAAVGETATRHQYWIQRKQLPCFSSFYRSEDESNAV